MCKFLTLVLLHSHDINTKLITVQKNSRWYDRVLTVRLKSDAVILIWSESIHNCFATVGRLSSSQLSNEQVQIYIKEENNKRRNLLQKYITLCTDARVSLYSQEWIKIFNILPGNPDLLNYASYLIYRCLWTRCLLKVMQ